MNTFLIGFIAIILIAILIVLLIIGSVIEGEFKKVEYLMQVKVPPIINNCGERFRKSGESCGSCKHYVTNQRLNYWFCELSGEKHPRDFWCDEYKYDS